jgi:hypothetical protein
MFVRYKVRPEISGWVVYDVLTGQTACFNGLILCGLCSEDADDVVVFLNRLQSEASSATFH